MEPLAQSLWIQLLCLTAELNLHRKNLEREFDRDPSPQNRNLKQLKSLIQGVGSQAEGIDEQANGLIPRCKVPYLRHISQRLSAISDTSVDDSDFYTAVYEINSYLASARAHIWPSPLTHQMRRVQTCIMETITNGHEFTEPQPSAAQPSAAPAGA